jgi:hypothetical protein
MMLLDTLFVVYFIYDFLFRGRELEITLLSSRCFLYKKMDTWYAGACSFARNMPS